MYLKWYNKCTLKSTEKGTKKVQFIHARARLNESEYYILYYRINIILYS